jgi:hypothetical protein
MVEMIYNEILTSNQPVEWNQIAGLAFAKQAVQEIVIWPMLQPELFVGLRQPPRGLLLFGPPGTGKCLQRGTPVLLSSGVWKRVEDVRVGDRLMGDDSKPRVVQSIATGRETMARVEVDDDGTALDDRELFVCNVSHILSLKAGASLAGVRAASGGWIAFWHVPVRDACDIVVDVCERVELCDAPTAAVARVALQLASGDALRAGDIVDIAVCDYLRQSVCVQRALVAFGAPELSFEGGELLPPVADLYAAGVELVRRGERIPTPLLTLPVPERRQLLAGIVDTLSGGTRAPADTELDCVDAELARDVAFVARSLGMRVETVRGADGARCRLMLRASAPTYPIRVRVLPVDDYYGFSISGSNRRFIAGHRLCVTHNTLIGKAIATQAKSTFFNISASSLTSKWIGDGEKMVRALFGVARAMQPSVIFIDEIDSLLTSRGDNEQEASRRIKTEFLLQMDGAAQGEGERLLVIGATNRPQELDEAVRRRMVKRLYIPLPDSASRQSLTQIMLAKPGTQHVLTEPDVARIASLTRGYSGADLAALAREAAMVPLRELSRAIGFSSSAMGSAVVRPLSVDDFIDALRTTRSSVAESELKHYREWNATFGSWAETDEE